MNLNSDITSLELSENIIKILNNNVFKINQLWEKTRKDLKLYKLNDREISNIIIKLELLGIGLNKKIYDYDRVKK